MQPAVAECVQNVILPGSTATAICRFGGHEVVARVRPFRARLAEVVAVGDRADDREDELRYGAARGGSARRSENCGGDEGGDEYDAEGCRPAGDHTHGFALGALTLAALPANRLRALG